MSRILLGWELGTGFGHLAPFLALAPRLLARGHELHVAAREIAGAARALDGLPVTLHQAPLCLNSYGGLQEPPLNYSEILMRYGYLEPPMLAAMFTAWRTLLRVTGTRLLLADHAPTALLAARSLGLPRALVGSPFNVPPPRDPLPNMRAWMKVPAVRLEDSDRRVREGINALLPAGAGLNAMHELFDGAARFLSGIPELDPYGPRDPADYLGLQSPSAGRAAPQWPAGTGTRVFAYLHGDYAHLDRALQALAASGADVLAHVLGGQPAQLQRHAGPRLRYTAELLDFERVAGECALCVCHGNVGTTLGMLRAGRPVLVLSKHLEHYLMGLALERFGAGRAVHPDDAAPDIAGLLGALLGDASCGRNARALAERHRQPAVGTILDMAVARIEALAAAGTGKSA